MAGRPFNPFRACLSAIVLLNPHLIVNDFSN
jgi:hypothetical protein